MQKSLNLTRTIVFLVLLVTCVSPASAATVTENGPLFDVEYDDVGFIFQTGVFINDMGMEEPFFEQLGGYTIINPTTIRYSLRPEETVPNPMDPTIFDIIPRGEIEVGGFPFLTTDSSSDNGMFRILPKPGQQISGVSMMAIGSFANPTEDASLLYSENLMAGGDSDSAGLSLGIFSSGPMPSALATMFADTNLPVDTTWDFSLDGTSSDPVEFSFASINAIEFTVTIVPEPALGLWAVLLSIWAKRALAPERR